MASHVMLSERNGRQKLTTIRSKCIARNVADVGHPSQVNDNASDLISIVIIMMKLLQINIVPIFMHSCYKLQKSQQTKILQEVMLGIIS